MACSWYLAFLDFTSFLDGEMTNPCDVLGENVLLKFGCLLHSKWGSGGCILTLLVVTFLAVFVDIVFVVLVFLLIDAATQHTGGFGKFVHGCAGNIAVGESFANLIDIFVNFHVFVVVFFFVISILAGGCSWTVVILLIVIPIVTLACRKVGYGERVVSPVREISVLLAATFYQRAYRREVVVNDFVDVHVAHLELVKSQEIQRYFGVGIDGEDAVSRDIDGPSLAACEAGFASPWDQHRTHLLGLLAAVDPQVSLLIKPEKRANVIVSIQFLRKDLASQNFSTEDVLFVTLEPGHIQHQIATVSDLGGDACRRQSFRQSPGTLKRFAGG
ncbi:hypothetical protein HG531_001846 [Fusarium graminearum]|nr:hypothetical protein HG531_001846 [Fusarium graminearum]